MFSDRSRLSSTIGTVAAASIAACAGRRPARAAEPRDDERGLVPRPHQHGHEDRAREAAMTAPRAGQRCATGRSTGPSAEAACALPRRPRSSRRPHPRAARTRRAWSGRRRARRAMRPSARPRRAAMARPAGRSVPRSRCTEHAPAPRRRSGSPRPSHRGRGSIASTTASTSNAPMTTYCPQEQHEQGTAGEAPRREARRQLGQRVRHRSSGARCPAESGA